ncbi:hypothetical protein LSG31_20555 [Fodinisporobacter ferrooxydans]|uniref:Uncharacterized protein n=1 Tax=Fodinisporobacter ferrooxydans TaxID=2901836 RepID=A0ABY4CI70_9BACL|nr:hypothetical protein LSG31_20555 [Alicyclobacillaceae bacterium MYW30-H2]
MRRKQEERPYTIHLHFGKEQLQSMIYDLAKHVIQKHVDCLHSNVRFPSTTDMDSKETFHSGNRTIADER